MRKFRVTVNDTIYEVEIEEIGGDMAPDARTLAPGPPPLPEAPPFIATGTVGPNAPSGRKDLPSLLGEVGTIASPMPGMINEVKVKVGDTVESGDVLVVLEAMKMENLLKADIAGEVKEVKVVKGQAVNSGDPLVIIA